MHPWQVHPRQCDQNEEVLGPLAVYPPIRVGDEGTGRASPTISMAVPTYGRYDVVVFASSTSTEIVIACGNFAAPTSYANGRDPRRPA